MPRVAIVIVTYNSALEIGACLDSVIALPDTEIVVVDNASRDATQAEVRHRAVRLLANARNTGFAAAVNQGVLASSAPLVLLLNPDTCFRYGLSALTALFDEPGTGAAGGLLIGPDGLPQTGFMARNLPTPAALLFEILGVNRLWPHNPANWHYRCLGNDVSTAFPAEQPAGAFLMFSRSAFTEIGGFDDRFYPVWFEDVDFCGRLKAAGYSVWFTPQAVANHTGGHSVGSLPVEIRQRYWYGSLLEYAAKVYPPLMFRVICLAVVLGAGLRAGWGFVTRSEGADQANLRKIPAAYAAVARLAFRRMFGLGGNA